MSNNFTKFFKGQFARIIAGAIDQKVDGRELIAKIDAELDEQLGEKTSERIQRTSIMNLLKEMIEGLWEESPQELRVALHNWIQDIEKKEK